MKYLLAIESSCDDTAAAILDPSGNVCADVVFGQSEFHTPYGGVVPEIASRHHLLRIAEVVRQAFLQAEITSKQVGLVAATYGPGLIGPLMVGLQFAKGFAQGLDVPFLGIHHIEGHLMAGGFEHEYPSPPFVALIASGGHCTLYLCDAHYSLKVLGQTRDDAPGEAFDKIGRLLGFAYPAGKFIDERAVDGNPTRYPLPIPMLDSGTLEFSFSGLKTAALVLIRRLEAEGVSIEGQVMNDICASVQHSIVESLLQKSFLACRQSGIDKLVLCGGVVANSELRTKAIHRGKEVGIITYVTPRKWCTDNAVMIARAAKRRFLLGQSSSLNLDAKASVDYPAF